MFSTASDLRVEREQSLSGECNHVHVQIRGSAESGTHSASLRSQPVLSKTPYHASNRENMNPEQEDEERFIFYHDLHNYMSSIGQPIQRLPTLGFKELDLWVLYKEVTRRRGVDAVIAKKQWKEVADALHLPASCTDSGFRLRLHYVKYLESFERAHFVPPPEMPQVNDDTRQCRVLPATAEKRKRVDEFQHPSSSLKLARQRSETHFQGEGSSFSSLITAVDSPQSPNGNDATTPPSEETVKSAPHVDFSKLDLTTLKRYRRHYHLQGLRANPTKGELVSSVSNHFSSLEPVQSEEQTLRDFMSAWVRSRDSGL